MRLHKKIASMVLKTNFTKRNQEPAFYKEPESARGRNITFNHSPSVSEVLFQNGSDSGRRRNPLTG
jgi:hypothetical protein